MFAQRTTGPSNVSEENGGSRATLRTFGIADDRLENRTRDTEGKLANTGRQYWKAVRFFFVPISPYPRQVGNRSPEGRGGQEEEKEPSKPIFF